MGLAQFAALLRHKPTARQQREHLSAEQRHGPRDNIDNNGQVRQLKRRRLENAALAAPSASLHDSDWG